MNYLKKNLLNIVLIMFMLFLPLISFGQTDTGTKPPTSDIGTQPPSSESLKLVNPIESKTLTQLIEKVLVGIVKLGMPIIVLAIIYSGFLFVAAQGNSEKLDEAKRSLIYTLIGAAILLGSWGLAQLITDTVKAL
ncbi:MAG: pilin [Burkholderiales bacterium]|nr:pilin [Burkholderiales bacterium]